MLVDNTFVVWVLFWDRMCVCVCVRMCVSHQEKWESPEIAEQAMVSCSKMNLLITRVVPGGKETNPHYQSKQQYLCSSGNNQWNHPSSWPGAAPWPQLTHSQGPCSFLSAKRSACSWADSGPGWFRAHLLWEAFPDGSFWEGLALRTGGSRVLFLFHWPV